MTEEREGIEVVFGAGQIGPLLAARLRSDGRRVRTVRKSSGTIPVEGVEVARGDAMDLAFCLEATRGAEVVYHCMNAPYFARVWAETLPRLLANLIAAAGRAGARLVVLDNLYALGRTGGRPMTEETPPNPCSVKGEIRARLHEQLMQAVRRGDVRAAVGRASDFFGPGAAQGSHLGERFFRQALAGKAAQVIVNPDTLHTYHFTRDVAAALAAIGRDAGADGLWMLPCAPAVSTRRLVEMFAAALGRPIELKRLPPFVLALALFVPFLRELKEMAYQWEEPFVVDDRRFRARFGDFATPLETASRETVAWAIAKFASQGLTR